MSTPFGRPDNVRQHGGYVIRFAHQLSVRAGTTVQSRWNSEQSATGAVGWQLVWWDGPTVALMRYVAAGLSGSIAGVDVAGLDWHRGISPRAAGLAMLRNLRRGLPPLGNHADCDGLILQLQCFDHPERATADEIQLADRLVRLGTKAPPEMAAYLERYGLAGLGEGRLPGYDNVFMLPPGRTSAGTGVSRQEMEQR
jgi:hypothetical protein